MKKQRINTFLTFNGKAEEAMLFYAETFPDAKITHISRYGKERKLAHEGDENLVLHGKLMLLGQEIMFLDMDSTYKAPDFNWAVSIYVDCLDEAEFDEIFKKLSENGIVMMGPEPVGNLRKCSWVTDKFGVTWQLIWE